MDEKLKAIWAKNKIVIIIGIVVLGALIAYNAITSSVTANREQAEKDQIQSEVQAEIDAALAGGSYGEGAQEGIDITLMQSQPSLRKRFGNPPAGAIWSLDGNLISLGDPSMSSEEVLFSYLRGVSTLDFSTVHKFSRDSSVLGTYEEYFNDLTGKPSTKDQFLRAMYKEALLSIQPGNIINIATFADDKMVYTVNVRMLDLSNKEFWKKDREEIFANLYLYEKTEEDKNKAEQYLNDYILEYYSTEDAVLKDMAIDFTVQRFPDIESGWLVSNDLDLDGKAQYTDGNLVVSYINQLFDQWKIDQATN